MKTPLLTVCLALFSTLALAQAPQGEAPKPAPKARFDCSQAKDPKGCEERRAKMKDMRAKAAKACEGKQAGERRDCMRHEMCNQSKDPKGCEQHTEKMKAAMQQARKACDDKPQGQERRDCVRQEMHKQEK